MNDASTKVLLDTLRRIADADERIATALESLLTPGKKRSDEELRRLRSRVHAHRRSARQ